MRYVKFRTWILLLLAVLGIFFLLLYPGTGSGPFQSSLPVTDSVTVGVYPQLYDAIAKRDASSLKPFLNHKSDEIRQQAWRAFANTPVDSIASFVDLAAKQNTATAWFGISKHNIGDEQVHQLQQRWTGNKQSGIARVLGQQDNAEMVDFLLAQLDSIEQAHEYQFALALGRLIKRFDLHLDEQLNVVQHAFSAGDHKTTRAYLYGWYYGDESRLSSVAKDTLMAQWQLLGRGISPGVDQYVNKMMPKETTAELTIFYNGEQRLDRETQLAIELATSVRKLRLTNQNSLAAKILLTNANPHVQVQTLESLKGKIDRDDDLYNYISGTMLTDTKLADNVWLQALETSAEIDSILVEKYEERLEGIPQENAYLMPQALAVYEQAQSPDEYLNTVKEFAGNDTLQTMYVLQSLSRYWRDIPDQEQTEQRINQVRSLVFDALDMGDRGVAFTAEPLLRNEQLFGATDFDQVNSALTSFSLPGDIEVFQAFGSLYYDCFRKQARDVIDSLAAKNYAPLNRSLADAGWDVKVSEDYKPDFRMPDWERLWKLGRHPTLTLETDKGDISIKMNTLSAPATVSMIDSLSRSGAYDGVPFHRVVPNFVIQGGDITRQDGFGGPDFVIPTEASEKGFIRSAVGIASAGSDTEGSQYFVMHQWKPHLNGNYTRFGKVVTGMKVVDKIVVGDKVLSTTWR